ncbi:hypothetical protein [Nocardia yunnanensis]|nr:hypothetical protein [Nocardia yunnanensis]
MPSDPTPLPPPPTAVVRVGRVIFDPSLYEAVVATYANYPLIWTM